MYPRDVAIFLLAIVRWSVCHNDHIHKFMTNEEIERIFQTNPDSVPQHWIAEIEISTNEKRHGGSQRSHSTVEEIVDLRTHMTIRKLIGGIDLWLCPTESHLIDRNTPVYFAEYAPQNYWSIKLNPMSNLTSKLGKLYDNFELGASLVIGTEDAGSLRVNGHIESMRLVVRSLPEKIAKRYLTNRTADFENRFSKTGSYHVIFEYDANSKVHSRYRADRSIARPGNFYPEILLIIDYSTFRTYGKSYGVHLLEYQMAFWNGIDLEYRNLKNPRVRIGIAGIIVNLDPTVTRYIPRFTINGRICEPNKALDASIIFLVGMMDKFPMESYDILVTLTRLPLGKPSTLRETVDIAGLSRHNRVCGKNGTMTATTLVKDDGAFAGAPILANEIGQILGLEDDNESATECYWRGLSILTATMKFTTNSSIYANCSIATIDESIKNHDPRCLYNRPRFMEQRLSEGKEREIRRCQFNYSTIEITE